jgi:hypothetical protein
VTRTSWTNNGFGVGMCRENDINHAEASTVLAAPVRGIGRAGIDVSTHYRPRIIVLTFHEGCLCTPIQEGLKCVVYEPIFHVLR